jgi:mono/diheme cytochrome c family protein
MRLRSVVLILVVASAAVIVYSAIDLGGFGNRTEPTIVERLAARAVRRLAVPRAGRSATNPVAFSDQVWAEGRAHFADHCASCHGNDGSGQTEMGRNLYPRSPDMRLAATQELSDGELYWIIENGVRLTGMPAWGNGTGQDTDTWKLVHFVRHLHELSSTQLKEMEGLNPKSPGDLAEEQQDRDFLEGHDTEASPSAPPSHHQH